MPTNKQRRETERRRLQRQLAERRRREARRKQLTLVGSIVGALVVVAAVVVGIILGTSGGGDKPAARSTPSTQPSTPSAPSSSAPVTVPTAACKTATKASTVTFDGVTVTGATNLRAAPKVVAKSTAKPTVLACADLVAGTGPAATPSSSVTVQYVGALLSNGTVFDSSWKRGQPVPFSLEQVVPGFTQGIGGAGKAAPMKVGGRRLIIVPSALGYGASGNQGIPPNAPLIFVVDLTKLGS